MADASKIIERLSMQVATLVRDNAILTMENEELRAVIATIPKDEPEQSPALGDGAGTVILKVWDANTLQVKNLDDLGWGILRAGNIYSNGSIVLTSDKDLKKNITIFEKPVESETALAAVKKIAPKFFEYKDEEEDNSYLGFVAQDLPAEIICVGDQDNNMLGYSLNERVAFLWKAVQELAEQVDILEQKEVLI